MSNFNAVLSRRSTGMNIYYFMKNVTRIKVRSHLLRQNFSTKSRKIFIAKIYKFVRAQSRLKVK